MRFMSRMASAALVVTALVFSMQGSGCSSSNNSNDGGGSAGYTGSTKLVNLSRADLTALCTQESANAAISCGGDAGTVNVSPIGVCTSIAASCTATVATSQACTTKLIADACNPGQLKADMASPECLVMLACANGLCTSSSCFCPDYNSLSACNATCKSVSAGLSLSCATCITGLFGSSMCPMALPAQCVAPCSNTDGGTKG
jgi:hypothetical protein